CDIDADFGLEARPASGERFVTEAAHLVLGIAEPARRGDVRGMAVAAHLSLARLALRRRGTQEVERAVAVERVAEIAPVDESDDLLGREIDDQLPHRLADALRPQVPQRIDDRGGGEMDHALVGAEPAQLRLVGEPAMKAGEIVDDLVEIAPED